MKVKVYIMHSEKIDYKNEIYRPLLELGLMKNYFLVLPYSEKFKASYIKETIGDSDVIICDLTNFNFFANLELKMAKKLEKTIYYFIQSEDKNINKYKDINIVIYKDKKDFSNKVKSLLDTLNKKELLLKRENIYYLGNVNKSTKNG